MQVKFYFKINGTYYTQYFLEDNNISTYIDIVKCVCHTCSFIFCIYQERIQIRVYRRGTQGTWFAEAYSWTREQVIHKYLYLRKIMFIPELKSGDGLYIRT